LQHLTGEIEPFMRSDQRHRVVGLVGWCEVLGRRPAELESARAYPIERPL